MTGPPADEEALAAVLSERVCGGRPVAPGDRLVADLGLDDMAVLATLVVLNGYRPGFRLPTQLDLEDVTVRDLHHYLTLPHPTV